MLTQEYDRRLLGLSTLHVKDQPLGQVRVFRCRRAGPQPTRRVPPPPPAHLADLRLTDRLPLRLLDQPHRYQLLLLEPRTLPAWEALQRLEARLASGGPGRVAVARLGATGGAVALPVPLATAAPALKGFKIFAAYYIPRLKVRRKAKPPPPTPLPAVDAPPAVELVKEEPKKREEPAERAPSVASRTPSTAAPKPEPLPASPAPPSPTTATPTPSHGNSHSHGHGHHSSSKPRKDGHGEKERRRRDDGSPKHKRSKSKRER